MKERKIDKFTQSYIYRDNGKCFYVSTVYRSTHIDAAGGEVWYFETFAWEWDKDTKARGELIADNSGAVNEQMALKQHFHVCELLHAAGEFKD